MKYLLALIFTLSAYAKDCTPWIPLSRAQAIAAITTYEQLADIPMKLCKDAPDEECVCSEGDVSASKIKDVVEPDTLLRIDVEACINTELYEPDPTKTDCEGKLASKVCTDPTFTPNMQVSEENGGEVFCEKQTYKVIGHKLVPDPEKRALFDQAKAEREAALALEMADKLSSCQAFQGLSNAVENISAPIPANANTIAALRAAQDAKNAVTANALKKAIGCLK
jgi:hypothetical protein